MKKPNIKKIIADLARESRAARLKHSELQAQVVARALDWSQSHGATVAEFTGAPEEREAKTLRMACNALDRFERGT